MRRFTIFIAFIAIATSLFGQTRLISVNDAKIIADRNATVLWENVSPGEPIIYYSADDNIVAYRFNYAVNKQFPNEADLKQECYEGKQNSNRKAQWGNGNYGNILMSARSDLPVIQEYGLSISSEYAYNEYLHEQAEAHLGSNYTLQRIYYINAVNVWHHYTNGAKDIYVKAHAPAKAGDYEVFQTAISEFNIFCPTGDYNEQWDQYLSGKKVLSKDSQFIIGHDECCPYYDWSYGCSPTAAAMLFGYWDNMSMYSNWNFSKFVDYHFERYDPVQEDIDSHCPNVLGQLAEAMNTNYSTGGTDREDIAPGYNAIASAHGYYFDVSRIELGILFPYLNFVIYEIDEDKPIHISIEGHSVLGVGYSDSAYVATHYTHQPSIVWIYHTQIEAIYPTIPVFDGTDLGIELTHPDGDQNYWGTGSGETLYAGDVYEITWNYDDSPGSYVSLFYSTDHGVITSWVEITPNTPNDGVYDWAIPAGFNSDACRIKINVYLSDGTFSGADGSYGDFEISPGGSIYTLGSESKVTTITTPDYYQFSHPYSTWCAVGVRPNADYEKWAINMFSNLNFNTELVSSANNKPVEFVVQDRHHTSSFSKGIKVYRTSGSDMATVEYEGSNETLSIGPNGSFAWPAGDVVEMYDVYLTPGTYAFDLNITSGSGDLDFGLFGSTDGIYYKNREAFLAQSTTFGAAVDEHFTIAITTADYYGLCVWANDENSPTYTIDIHDPDPGTWEGDNSVYWADPYNWSFNTPPDASTDITIPAGTMYSCMLTTGSASCNSLTVCSGAVLNINGQTLSLMDMSIDGSVEMLLDNSIIYIYGDVEWNAGSSLNVFSNNTNIHVYGDWNFNEGANVNPQMGFVDFRGTTTEYIRCYSDNCSFFNLRVYKSGGTSLGLSAMSTERFMVNNLTYLNTGAIFNSYSPHGMLMKGSFNYYGTFDFNTGSVTFDGTDIQQFGAGSGTFNNVIINSPSGTTHLINGDMTVTGDFTIAYGSFNPDANTIFIAGDWINNTGFGSFATGRVVFNGSIGDQYCVDETFNILEIDKSAGNFKVENTDVECTAYDWTAGAVDVTNGSFTANDLIDDGIVGAFYANDDAIINLHNPTGLADLNGDLIISGGEINVFGSGTSWIPYVANASITMSSGVLDFKSTSLRIDDGLILTTNITGGTIRTIGNFANYRTDFNLPAGTLEMYGSSDATLYQDDPSNYLNNVVINKVNDDGLTFAITPDKKDAGNSIKNSKANNVNMTSDIIINNNLTVNAGSLTLNGYELTVLGDCDIFGTLNMTNVADILNVGDDSYENLVFRNGSFGNLTAGIVNLASWVGVLSGGLLTATTGNTMNFIDGNESGIQVDDPGSVFGNINLVSVDPFRLYSTGGYTIEVDGNFDIQPGGNIIDSQDNSMIIHGNFTDDPSSIVYVHNGPVDGGNSNLFSAESEIKNQILSFSNTETGSKGGYLEIDTDFIQYGLMDVGDGNVLAHGIYSLASSGTLIIDGGTLTRDGPFASASVVLGTFTMPDGIFESTHNHIGFNPSTHTIAGGTIRCGGIFISSIANCFQPTGGSVELFGPGSTDDYIQMDPTNYFHNLVIDRTNTIQIEAGYDLSIKNDFTILSGGLNTNGKDIYIGGDWDNTVGPDAFIESSGKVVFNGTIPSMQYIHSDEQFNIIENNTTQAISIQDADIIECNSYNWLSGGVNVYQGTFIANDLAQSGVYGDWEALDGSEIYLYQDPGQYVDMYASELYISGGLMKITGGDDESWWCNGSTPLTLDIINGGALDFDGPGVTIFNSQTLTENISSGTFKTSGWFACSRTDFYPTGGTFEFYGGNDAQIDVDAGSTLFNVLINKSGGNKSVFEYKDREGNIIKSTKSNEVNLTDNLVINSELIVNEGTLSLNANTLNCYGDININSDGVLNIPSNSTLEMSYDKYIHVNSGGLIELLGSAGNPATITSSAGHYNFWIENGGTISANYGVFDYVRTNGVYLSPGSFVDPANSFNNCTFQNGNPDGCFILVDNDQTFTATNVHFLTNTWGSAYNVYKGSGSNPVYFHNASGGFAGPEFEFDGNNTLYWTTDTYQLDLEVFLEGPFNPTTNQMNTDLKDLDLIPYIQPFNDNPSADWYYTGPESVGTIPAFAVDWVLVELRDATDVASAIPSRAIARQAAFLLNNGDVVDLDGLPLLEFDAAVFNDLYVNIWHRNHLGVISAAPLVNVGGNYSFSFMSAAGQAYGGISAQVQLSPGIWGILSGDSDGDGEISLPDKTIWFNDAGITGYIPGDFNLDGQTNNIDKNDTWLINFGKVSQVPD